MIGSGSTKSKQGAHNRALRLWFEYKRSNVNLLSIQRLNMIPPPPQALSRHGEEAAASFELQDRSGQALYRRIINNPVRRDLEVVTDDAERSVARVAWEAGGTFFLLMPDIPQAARLVLKTGRAAAVPVSGEKADALPALETHEFDLTGMGQEDC